MIRSARFNRPFWDYSRIPQLVFGLISTGLLDASHLNSVTNLRAQQARLVKNTAKSVGLTTSTMSKRLILLANAFDNVFYPTDLAVIADFFLSVANS